MLRNCPACSAIIVGRDGRPPRECPFCNGPIEHAWEGTARKLIMASAVVLGATALAHPWSNFLLPLGQSHSILLPTAPRPFEVLVLQVLTWIFLVAAAWALTRKGKPGLATSWWMLAVAGWFGACLLTIPPGVVPYELTPTPLELGGIMGSTLELSGAALFCLATFGEVMVGNLAFRTIQ